MLIIPGMTYRLTFDDSFVALNGIYTVLQLLSHEEMIELDVSVETTYEALGIADDFLIDKKNYLDKTYIKIKSIEDETIYYISEVMLTHIPDFTAQEYYKLGLVINLGVYGHTDDVGGLSLAVKNLLTNNYGITTDPIVTTHGKSVWLTDTEYQTIKDERESNKGVISNIYVVKKKLSDENSMLRQRIATLEAMIIALQ